MVMSAGNAFVKDNKFNSDKLGCVSAYQYVGLVWSTNGNLSNIEQKRIGKKMPSFAIGKSLSTIQNVSVYLALSFCDK